MTNVIRCRARLADVDCYDGSPTSRQFGEEDGDLPMSYDGTYDGSTIVCDACYIALMPFTPSQQGLHGELTAAIDHYERMLTFARAHDAPQELVLEADRALQDAEQGTAEWASARACKRMAEREVARRETTP
jgi:hypothetical protein